MTYAALIERVEKATGRDRELDVDLQWALDRRRAAGSYWNARPGMPEPFDRLPEVLPPGLGREGVRAGCPNFTTSIDAAFALASAEYPNREAGVWVDKENGCWRAYIDDDHWDEAFNRFDTKGANGALALVLAVLKAKQAELETADA